MHGPKCFGERLRVGLEPGRDRRRGDPGIGGDVLVPDLERVLGRRPRGRQVALPRPRRSRCLARARELTPALGLDPRPGMDAERLARVVVALAFAEPAHREQRAHDIATVADDVEHGRLRVRAYRGTDHEAELGRLLDRPKVADEGEPPDPLDRRAELPRGLVLSKRHPAIDVRFQRLHLAEVDEAGLCADCAGEERRPRARRADDEDDSLPRELGIAAALT